jgi:D-serine deaminase-like pyridoxal phosphate-dependent protein
MDRIGQDVQMLDTPVLWVDLDLMDKNIRGISRYLREAGVNWRPHTKGIKIPAVAHKLLDAGAIGVTCAKLSEAEVMAAGGVKDILVANQVVGETKITRLCALRHHADVMVAVADLENASEISKYAVKTGVEVRVLVEVNTGMNRAGVEPGQPALEFASRLAALPGIQLAGLMGWEGHVVGIPDPVTKRAECERAVQSLVETAVTIRGQGIPLPIVSCGGSGSYQITAHIPGVTEIQAGGAVFGDVTYRKWGANTDCALFVLSTVTNRPAPTRAIIDAGRKTLNAEISMPEVLDKPGARLVDLSAEHGYLELDDPNLPIKTGDRVNIIVGYGDLTVCLHNQLVGARKGKVEVVWDISGRGKLT